MEPFVLEHLGRHCLEVTRKKHRCFRILPELFERHMKNSYSKQDQPCADSPKRLPFDSQKHIGPPRAGLD